MSRFRQAETLVYWLGYGDRIPQNDKDSLYVLGPGFYFEASGAMTGLVFDMATEIMELRRDKDALITELTYTKAALELP